jgi:hypothetical protein
MKRLKIKDQKSKIKIVELPLRGNGFLIFAFCILIFTFPAYPCSTPVFRYAMERWMADYYDGVLIYENEIPDDDPAALLLQGEDSEFLNLRLQKINLNDEESWKFNIPKPVDGNQPTEAMTPASVLKSQLGIEIPEKLPTLVLWYPWLKGRAAPFWTGEFTPSTIKALIGSAKRQELARRLTDGQTAVWVFVESGNATKDKAALKLIEQELEGAKQQLKEMAAEFPTEPGVPSFEYQFSTLTISRSDPNEQMLLTMLLRSEPDLDEYKAEPIVFPVFGRGRALFALVGEGINSDNLREAIAFITGPCGCEIKMMNPGVDMLMSVNWDASVMQFYEEFYETQEEDLPELTSVFPEEPASNDSTTTQTFAKTVASDSDETVDLQSEQGRDVDMDAVSDVNSIPDIDNSASGQERTLSTVNEESRGLGVMGTTAVSVGAILAVVALGTLVVTRRHP